MYIWNEKSHTIPVIRNKRMIQEVLNMSKNQNQMSENSRNCGKNSQKNCGRNNYESSKSVNSAGQNSKNSQRQGQNSRSVYGEEE